MTGKIEQGIGLSDAQALRTIADFHNLVAGCDFAGFQYAEVEAGSVMLDQQGGHARLVHADSNPVASHPGCVTSNRALPIRYRSPMQTSSSGNPSTVKFSPNCPNTKSFRPSCLSQ